MTRLPAPKKLLRRIAVVVGSTIVGLVLVELGLRAGSELFFPRMMRLDEHLGWRHRPGVSKRFANENGEMCLAVTNRYGNRGVAWPPARTPGTYRVLVLGDSFTEAVQVGEEEVFTARLQAQGGGLEVINAGVAAYGTVQEYLYLRDEGLAFRPDLVLLMVYGNDLGDNVLPYALRIGPRPFATLEGGRLDLVEDLDEDAFAPFCAPVPFRAFLYRNSYAFYAFNDRVWQPRRMDALTELDKRNMAQFDVETEREVMRQMLARLQALVAPVGSELALFLIPTRDEVAARSNPDHDRIAGWCNELGIACIPGLPPLCAAAAQGGEPCYFPSDIHWTRAGHAVAAVEIGRFLDERRASTGNVPAPR